MISFRYHLVSIVGIFLALAVGIVVGMTVLNGPITKGLHNRVHSLTGERDRLSHQVKTLQGQVGDANRFASTYGGRLVADTLSKQDVLLVTLPGAGSMTGGVKQQVTAAGATVTGQLSIESPYTTVGNTSSIQSLSIGSARPISWTAPTTHLADQLGGSLLAYVLLGKGQKSDLSQVLGALSELHMVSADSSIASAPNVVVVGGGQPSAYARTMELGLVQWLGKYGGHVLVAGDTASARGRGLVAAIRNDSTVRGTTSTVDDADTAFGQVSSALALAGDIKGQTGQYGTQNGADSLYPAPAS